ncbi:MAG: dTDP-4-dehydrorhamnose 3,5-epimerase [Armatimonadetes bacterium]|nr:dTDP-4-dehydrorhamnose 3,5-epimerase [Armatimonadota bacterium]
MVFTETRLKGAFVIEPEKLEDERGFFARTFCRTEFESRGLDPQVTQCSISFNAKKGTLRGMHYQAPPFQETKLVRCTMGSVYDVLLDLRQGSLTFKEWVAIELTARSRRILYIPEGFAHGFQTLEDGTEVFYQISVPYHPECARGVRWDDPAFGIEWPSAENRIISPKDLEYADFG